MKHYRVRLAKDAEQDLIDIYRYIALHDCVENADYWIGLDRTKGATWAE